MLRASTRLLPLALVLASFWCTRAAAEPPAPEEADAAAAEPEREVTTGADGAPPRRGSRGPALAPLAEILVEADRPLTAASSQVIRARDYALRPHSTTQEIMNNVPGLMVVQHQGGGKAAQYLIRGFDADHGTDFAVFTDGIPVNLVSHAHGQGYADLNYLIPETVKNLELFKGPYFVDLGDFATAGALTINTKDHFDQNFAFAEGGYFDTQRYVLGGSPPLDWARTLLAGEAYFTNGPFDDPQHYARYNVFGKLTLDPTPDRRLSLLASVYYADWDGSGQIPLDCVGNPACLAPGSTQPPLDRFGSLDPSEGGTTDRENLSAQYTYKPDATTTWDAQLWGSRYYLKLFSDFTFFRNTGLRFIGLDNGGFVDTCADGGYDPDTGSCGPVDPTANYIPGDGIEQQDQGRLLYGGHLAYSKFWSLISLPHFGEIPMQSTLGLQFRQDHTDLSLYNQVRRNRLYAVNKVGLVETSVSGYWGQQFFISEWMRLEAGVRGDVFFFDVHNRLPEQAPDRNFAAVSISGNDVDGLASPKVNLVLGPWYETEVYLNYGNGFHSNDARAVVLTGTSGLAVANGHEIGARTRQFDRLDFATALWLLDLDSELVFSGDGGSVDADVDPVTGNFIPGGASRRWGVDVETRYRITDWLFADYDLTWDDPRFKNGDAIPLAPTLLMNGGLTAEFANGFAAALRVRYLGNRPANETRTLTAQGFTLLDLLLRYRWRNVEASLAFLNLTDTEWREAQFADATCARGQEGSAQCPVNGSIPNPPPPQTPSFAEGIEGITFTPGNPFNIRGGLQIFF